MKTIGPAVWRALSDAARGSARRRKNLNIHATLDDPVQRLLNAFEPGTYVRPHRHRQPPKWELFAILEGRAAVLTFDDDGRVLERIELDAAGDARVVEIPESTWHTLVALMPGTVMLEVKRGPYQPNPPQDFAAWAPAEGEPAAVPLELWFRRGAPGERAPALR